MQALTAAASTLGGKYLQGCTLSVSYTHLLARRLVILASEDIGLANPNALLLANACFHQVHKIGMHEARITLAETTSYLDGYKRQVHASGSGTRLGG